MVGSHLLEILAARGERDVLGSYFRPTIRMAEIEGRHRLAELDMRDAEAVRLAIAEERPAVIYHLAAQSLPTRSWIDPWETMEVNVRGAVNLFEAIKLQRGADPGYDPVVLVAGSSAQYGASLTPENVPIGEDLTPLPLHPYGISKVAQDLLAFQYWRNDAIRSIRARIFNCTGPRKHADVVSDFARRVAHIERHGGRLRVGNLAARRAILDVRDLVAALMLLAERGAPGEAYNICSEAEHSVAQLIPVFERLCGRTLQTETDPQLLRPSDEAVIFGRNDRLFAATGWRQQVAIEETIRSVLDYERAHLAA